MAWLPFQKIISRISLKDKFLIKNAKQNSNATRNLDKFGGKKFQRKIYVKALCIMVGSMFSH